MHAFPRCCNWWLWSVIYKAIKIGKCLSVNRISETRIACRTESILIFTSQTSNNPEVVCWLQLKNRHVWQNEHTGNSDVWNVFGFFFHHKNTAKTNINSAWSSIERSYRWHESSEKFFRKNGHVYHPRRLLIVWYSTNYQIKRWGGALTQNFAKIVKKKKKGFTFYRHSKRGRVVEEKGTDPPPFFVTGLPPWSPGLRTVLSSWCV